MQAIHRLEGGGVTNFLWPLSTLGIFVVTFNNVNNEITLYGSLVDGFLRTNYQRLTYKCFNIVYQLDL